MVLFNRLNWTVHRKQSLQMKFIPNTTRIDVRGNRLPVTLPIDNWTSVADGQLVPGLTASWYPLYQGTKSISATYQGYTDTVQVFVTRGLIRVKCRNR